MFPQAYFFSMIICLSNGFMIKCLIIRRFFVRKSLGEAYIKRKLN